MQSDSLIKRYLKVPRQFDVRVVVFTWCCAVFIECCTAQAQNLVVNGSFESGAYTGNFNGQSALNAGSTAITGWTVVVSDLLWLNNTTIAADGGNVFSSDGERWLDLTGFDVLPYGGVEQFVTTQTGQNYRLEFDFGSNPADYGNTHTLAVEVAGDLSTFAFTGFGDSSQYERYGFKFSASSSSTSIRFYAVNPSGVHAGLDNVVMIKIPEPAGALLSIVGASLFTGFARLRGK